MARPRRAVYDPTRMDLPEILRPLAEALIGRPELSRVEVAQGAGIDPALARRLWRALGFPPTADDARVFTRSDMAVLAAVRRLLEDEDLDVAVLLQLTRVMGQSLARVAEAQVTATRLEPATGDIVANLTALAPQLERLIGFVWRRHLLAALLRHAAHPSASEPSAVVGFADMVGFTMLSQALDSHELAAMVDRFEAIAYEYVLERGGRVVKLIGDEVMFTVDDPLAGAEIGLALAEAVAGDTNLPDVRVGLAHGAMVAWEGDLYGPTVNLASRLVNLARPRSVLASDALGEALQQAPGLTLRHLRPVHLQGFGRVRSWVVRRAMSNEQ